ncbi:hypothetical protein, partial [Streptomyces sp. MBT51]
MAWVRLSDDFYDHPKFQRVGALGVALWAEGLAWSNRNLTDGRIPRNVARRLIDFEDVVDMVVNSLGNAVTNGGGNPAGNPENHAVAASVLRQSTIIGLVDARLWLEAPDGYVIHDYLDYQKSAEQIHSERDKNAARQRAFKERRKRASGASPAPEEPPADGSSNEPSNDSSNGVTDTGTHGPVTDAPNPNPNTSLSYEREGDSPGSEIPDDTPTRDDVEQACAALANAIEANGSKRPTITKTWRREARLLIDRDGRSLDQVLTAIAWCQADTFWRGNVLSMPKLRAKYDQLRLAAQRQSPPPRPQSTGPGYDPNTGTDLFDRAMERAKARDAAAAAAEG